MEKESIDEVVITGSKKELEKNAVLNLHITYPQDGKFKSIKPKGINHEMAVTAIHYLEAYLAQEERDDLLKPSYRPC